MSKLYTVENAKREVERLKRYLELVEEYEANTLERWVIKEYAYTNSFTKVAKRANEAKKTYNGTHIDAEYVRNVINSKPIDELHKTLKSGYLLRTRSSRNRKKSYV